MTSVSRFMSAVTPVIGRKSSVPSHLRIVFTCWRFAYACAGELMSGSWSKLASLDMLASSRFGGSIAENARRTGGRRWTTSAWLSSLSSWLVMIG